MRRFTVLRSPVAALKAFSSKNGERLEIECSLSVACVINHLSVAGGESSSDWLDASNSVYERLVCLGRLVFGVKEEAMMYG